MSNENVHPIFQPILDSFAGALPTHTLPTSEGDKTTPEIMDVLMWGSYSANRECGCTHEQLVRHGIGNETMRQRYDWEQLNKKH